MTAVSEMLGAYPIELGTINRKALALCIEECMVCAQACTACAAACLAQSEEQLPMLRNCIRSNQDCADMCQATERILSRHNGPNINIIRAALQACATVCGVCGNECATHAERMEHCRVCAEVCRRCQRACEALLETLG